MDLLDGLYLGSFMMVSLDGIIYESLCLGLLDGLCLETGNHVGVKKKSSDYVNSITTTVCEEALLVVNPICNLSGRLYMWGYFLHNTY